jgi:hypothetical protein
MLVPFELVIVPQMMKQAELDEFHVYPLAQTQAVALLLPLVLAML